MKITIGKGSITIRPNNSKEGNASDDGNNVGTNGENDTESSKIYSSNESPDNSIKHDNEQENLEKKDKTDDSENSKV